MSERKKTFYIICILQVLILASAVLIGRSLGKSQTREVSALSTNIKFSQDNMIKDVALLIKNRYKDSNVDEEKLVYGAIKGMVEALNDPYSQFMTEEIYEEIMDDTSGKFGGLGIEIGITSFNGYRRLTVISPIEGTPAYKAGLEAGDYITKINGESTFGINLDKAKQKLRGKPGTKVNLTIMRENEDDPIDISITRDLIKNPTVRSRVLDNSVGYIRISQFADTTPENVEKALNEFEIANVKGVILDLRTNPGGTLSSAVDVASFFLKEGQLIVYTKGRTDDDRMEYVARKGSSHPKHPLVVLIDEWSASGSEIVVGAIRDHKRGLIVGTGSSTFGKGSVQTIFPMRDGKTGLKLTVADYYTPNGKNINLVGIEPDIKYDGFALMPSEARMFRKLRSSKSLDEFISEAGDDILKRLNRKNGKDAENPDDELFKSFVKKLSQEDIVLSENLIKLAIAEKTKDETDEYEYDPVIKFAISHLRALDVLNLKGGA